MMLLAIAIAIYVVLSIPQLPRRCRDERLVIAIAIPFLFAGASHFINPVRFVAMIDGVIPEPRAAVYLSGVLEIAGALGLLLSRTRRVAGIGLTLLLVGVFPANLLVALESSSVDGMPAAGWYYWARLPVQLVFIAWVLRAAGLWRARRLSSVA